MDLVKGENIGKKLVALSDLINGEAMIKDNESAIHFRAGQALRLLADGSVEELDVAKDSIEEMRSKYNAEIEVLNGADTSFLQSQVEACNTAMGLLNGYLQDGTIDVSGLCNSTNEAELLD